MVVALLSSASFMPASSHSRSMSCRMVSGLTLRTLTLALGMGRWSPVALHYPPAAGRATAPAESPRALHKTRRPLGSFEPAAFVAARELDLSRAWKTAHGPSTP